jgi:small conductance mechanosensitive channel
VTAAGVTAWAPGLPFAGSSDSSKTFLDRVIEHGVAVLVIIAIAVALRFLIMRAISRVVRHASEGTPLALRPLRGRARERAEAVLAQSALVSERRQQRAATMGSVLRSITSVVVYGTAFVVILEEVGIPVAPILASASIVGVAVGFGAQNLVRDFLSGIFMILEDQYGVGDVVDIGPATGTVEAVSLRVTRLRDGDGTVWHVRNGEVTRVGNFGQGFSKAVLDVPVGTASSLDRATEVVQRALSGLLDDPDLSPHILEEPESLGVDSVDGSRAVLRFSVKTAPLQQWAVARAARRRIKEALDDAGIPLALPQQEVIVREAQVRGS